MIGPATIAQLGGQAFGIMDKLGVFGGKSPEEQQAELLKKQQEEQLRKDAMAKQQSDLQAQNQANQLQQSPQIQQQLNIPQANPQMNGASGFMNPVSPIGILNTPYGMNKLFPQQTNVG